jgi:hypothetical protein
MQYLAMQKGMGFMMEEQAGLIHRAHYRNQQNKNFKKKLETVTTESECNELVTLAYKLPEDVCDYVQ